MDHELRVISPSADVYTRYGLLVHRCLILRVVHAIVLLLTNLGIVTVVRFEFIHLGLLSFFTLWIARIWFLLLHRLSGVNLLTSSSSRSFVLGATPSLS